VQLHVLRAWVQRGARGSLDRVSTESAEHRAIVAALLAQDFAGYAAATRQHLNRSLKDNVRDLQKMEPSS
jgi:DNA-binding GntR family transcriptional regulator